MHTALRTLTVLTAALLTASSAPGRSTQEPETTRGPDALDAESTRLVRAYTTEPAFLTEWVDHVPEHASVPSPRDFLGHVIGAPDTLTRPHRINAYFRELERTSDRVQVFSLGRSHGGREMILAAVGDAEQLAELDTLANFNHLLQDPRLGERSIVDEAAPRLPVTYLLTAGLHSPETGPPEMVMELAYRLAVSEQPHIREIRAGVVTLIAPVLEMDGRDRQVQWFERHLTEVTDREDAPPLSPPYWGDYTFHDNNRDGLQLSQPLTQNLADAYHRFAPQVALDLHESVPLLYVSLGTGPYSPTLDPITIGEWQWMASYDVQQATSLGLRGVWTWAFYTGWYPGYLAWMANNHNGVGRFYETFGNSLPGTFERDLRNARYADERVETRTWYRAWPPEQKLTWSLRNNTNYMQTGVLASLQLAARNRETILRNAWQKSVNALERGRTEKPYAFHVPAARDDSRTPADPGALAELLRLCDGQRLEVHRLREGATFGERELLTGDLVVRMDQPFRDLALTLLGRQEFPTDAEFPPYDDVSWSYGLMLGLDVEPIDDPAVLELAAERLEQAPKLGGDVPDATRWLLPNRGQAGLAGLAYAVRAAAPESAELRTLSEAWNEYPAGSLVIAGVERDALAEAAARFQLDLVALAESGAPTTASLTLPRLALFHNWTNTQDTGWARYSLEQFGVPFTVIDKDAVRAGGLAERFDVLLFPQTRPYPLKDLITGIDTRWSPLAYTRTDEFPAHGTPFSSPDITGGLGFDGLAEIQSFALDGGLVITLGNAGVVAADSGIAPDVDSLPPSGNPGSHVTAKVLRPEHPITWGVPELTHVFQGAGFGYAVPDRLRGRALLQLGTQSRTEARNAEDRKAGLAVSEEADESATGETDVAAAANTEPADAAEELPTPPLCLSGGLPKPDALERRAAILDVPIGEGRCVLFGWNPLHRHQNRHDFAFLANALLFHEHFPAVPSAAELERSDSR